MLGICITFIVLGTFLIYVVYDFIQGFNHGEHEEWENRLEFELIKLIERELRGYRTGAINTYVNTRTGQYKAVIDLIEVNQRLQPIGNYEKFCIIAQEKLKHIIAADINIVKKYPNECICTLDIYGYFTEYYVMDRRTL